MSYYTCYMEEFHSIKDLMHTVENREVNKIFEGRSHSSHDEGDVDWYLTHNFDEARDKMFMGWDEHVPDVKAGLVKLDKLLTVESMIRVTPRANFVGHAPSVPRFMLGLPQAMIDSTREPSKQRTLSILYGFGGLGNVSASSLLRAGISLLAGISAIERLGIRVRLDVVRASSCGREMATFRLMVKDYTQPLDLRKLCFPIANPSMQRRIAFDWLEKHPDIKDRDWADGYGSSLQGNYAGKVKEEFDAAVLRPDEVLLFQNQISKHGFDIAAAFAEAGITILKERLEKHE